MMLHIIKFFKTIFCFLLSPLRALHNCLFKKRLRQNLLPTYSVDEDDSINALLPSKVSGVDLMTYYEKICGKKTDSNLSAMVGMLSPNNADEVQAAMFSGKKMNTT